MTLPLRDLLIERKKASHNAKPFLSILHRSHSHAAAETAAAHAAVGHLGAFVKEQCHLTSVFGLHISASGVP
jgi:hypothetical protein